MSSEVNVGFLLKNTKCKYTMDYLSITLLSYTYVSYNKLMFHIYAMRVIRH